MGRHRRLRRTIALAALSAALAVSAVAPSLASGQGVVDDLLKGLGLGGQGATTGPAGVPGVKGSKPPARGSNPDAQGSTSTLDYVPSYVPSNDLPMSGGTTSGVDGEHENVVLGGSRGEQVTDGAYPGEIVVLSLFGFDVITPVETGPGESESGLLGPIQQTVLDSICAGSGGQLCLAALHDDSETPNSDSTNSFRAAKMNLGVYLGGRGSLHTSPLESNGNIRTDSSCRTSDGDSVATLLSFGEDSVGTVSESSTDSQACNNGTNTQSNDSRWLAAFGSDAPSPCESGTRDAEFTMFTPVRSLVCNDTNGVGEDTTQAGQPFGMREALTVFLFEVILVMTGLAATRLAVRHRGAGF
jgi:hypothetical protein